MMAVSCAHQRLFEFAPQTTALIVIDMQRDFLASGGASDVSGFDLTPLRAIVPRLQVVLQAARARSGYLPHT